MAIGDKHQKILNENFTNFYNYANKCGAEIAILEQVIDVEMLGNVYSQKLLIPNLFSSYDMLAFFDLDIVIGLSAPSIFEVLPHEKGFGAVLDQRNSPSYRLALKIWSKLQDDEIISSSEYFKSAGFLDLENIEGSINGGVWVCRPKIVGPMFSKFYYEYFSDFSKKNSTFDEAPLAYLSQKANLFFDINEIFNAQIIYQIFRANRFIYLIIKIQKKVNKLINKFGLNYINFFYLKWIEKMLKRGMIVHFSGGFPIPKKLKFKV